MVGHQPDLQRQGPEADGHGHKPGGKRYLRGDGFRRDEKRLRYQLHGDGREPVQRQLHAARSASGTSDVLYDCQETG